MYNVKNLFQRLRSTKKKKPLGLVPRGLSFGGSSLCYMVDQCQFYFCIKLVFVSSLGFYGYKIHINHN